MEEKLRILSNRAYELKYISDFIEKFKKFESFGVLRKTFTDEWCLEFARILKRYFPTGNICRIRNKGHYIFKFHGKFFDITGVVQLEHGDQIEYKTF